MKLECLFEERVSKKSGNKYYCLFIPLLEKMVMLEPAEIKLIQVLAEKQKESK